MAAKGIQFPWRWNDGTVSPNLEVIWGMSVKSAWKSLWNEELEMQYGLKMLVVSIPLVLSYSATAGADAHTNDAITTESTHCLSGCPSGAPSSNIVLNRDIYTLSNNGSTKLAQWVAYVITTQTIGKSPKRVWRRDPDLPADETLSPDDYKGANAALAVDRGHQVPLASFAGTDDWKVWATSSTTAA